MEDTIGQRILTGNSIPLPEYDIDDDSTGSEVGREVEEDAEIQYMFQTILSSIGSEEFRPSFLSNIQIIRQVCTFSEQKQFCEYILYRISQVYNYEFPINISLESEDDLENVYNFLSFLEYNHKNFLIFMWNNMDVDIKNLDIETECTLKEDLIINLMERITEVNRYPKTIELFLRTNRKSNLIEWFKKISIRSESLIKAELLRKIHGREK